MAAQRTVAVLGTGTMGAPMAANLASAGFTVRAWNRTRARAEPLREHGVEICDDPADAGRGAEVVLTMLFDLDALEAAAPAALDAAGPGVVWVQASTVGVAGCARLADLAGRHDAVFVDAPVLGTREPAQKGQLVVLASGPPAARDTCQPLFDALGKTPRWLGPAGTGSRLKMVVNSWVLTLNAAAASAMALAGRLGVDPSLFLQAIDGGSLDCPYAHIKGEAILQRDFTANFSVEGAAKDAALILDAARGAGVRLAVTEGVRHDLEQAARHGYGGHDMAAVFLSLTDGPP